MDRCYTCYTCYTCSTDDFTHGRYTDVTSPAETHSDLDNLYCLGCAVKYTQQGVAEFEVLPSAEQIEVELHHLLTNVGTN